MKLSAVMLLLSLALAPSLGAFESFFTDPWGPFVPGKAPLPIDVQPLYSTGTAFAEPNVARLSGYFKGTSVSACLSWNTATAQAADTSFWIERNGVATQERLLLPWVVEPKGVQAVDVFGDSRVSLVLQVGVTLPSAGVWTPVHPKNTVLVLAGKDAWAVYSISGTLGSANRLLRSDQGAALLVQSMGFLHATQPTTPENLVQLAKAGPLPLDGRPLQIYRLLRISEAGPLEDETALAGFPVAILMPAGSFITQAHHASPLVTEADKQALLTAYPITVTQMGELHLPPPPAPAVKPKRGKHRRKSKKA